MTCRIAAHHFADVRAFVAEVWRVLKPGGTFALVDNISPDAESTPGFSEAELLAAALAYNAFEKLRDPSHGRCLGMVEWTALLAAQGFTLLHKERLPKTMELRPWALRMGSDAPTLARLGGMLSEGSPALKAFLKPQAKGDEVLFTLDEAILIARKPT